MKAASLIARVAMMTLAAAPAQAAVPAGAILAHTPWWVYALFAWLAWSGLLFTRTRSVPVWRLLTQPAIFIVWGLVSLGLAAPAHPFTAVDWLLAAIAGVGLALVTTKPTLSIDRASSVVTVPGSWLPLLRGLAIFAAKYAIGVAMAQHLAAPGSLLLLDMAVSGASAGYFIGWAIRLDLIPRPRRIAAALLPNPKE